MTPKQRRKALEAFFSDGKYAQFGQKNDLTTANGAEACTHVCWQALIKLWTGQDLTIDQVSEVAGYRREDVGMNSRHIDRIIAEFDLPYIATWRSGMAWTTADLVDTVRTMGPAQLAVPYGFYPLDKTLNAVGPNGEAYQGGRNDLSFAGNHAVLLFGARWRPKRKVYKLRGMDPDHGSRLRPAIPDFDIYTQPQLAQFWNRNLVGKSYDRFGYVPTEAWEGIPE